MTTTPATYQLNINGAGGESLRTFAREVLGPAGHDLADEYRDQLEEKDEAIAALQKEQARLAELAVDRFNALDAISKAFGFGDQPVDSLPGHLDALWAKLTDQARRIQEERDELAAKSEVQREESDAIRRAASLEEQRNKLNALVIACAKATGETDPPPADAVPRLVITTVSDLRRRVIIAERKVELLASVQVQLHTLLDLPECSAEELPRLLVAKLAQLGEALPADQAPPADIPSDASAPVEAPAPVTKGLSLPPSPGSTVNVFGKIGVVRSYREHGGTLMAMATVEFEGGLTTDVRTEDVAPWPPRVTVEEFEAWHAVQPIMVNVDAFEYARLRDAGMIDPAQSRAASATIEAPAASADEAISEATGLMIGDKSELKAPNGKAVILKRVKLHAHTMAGELERYELQTPRGRQIARVIMLPGGPSWRAYVSDTVYGDRPTFEAILAWVYARDKHCGDGSATKPAAQEAATIPPGSAPLEVVPPSVGPGHKFELIEATPADVRLYRVEPPAGIVTAFDLVDHTNRGRIGRVHVRASGAEVPATAIIEDKTSGKSSPAASAEAAIDLVLEWRGYTRRTAAHAAPKASARQTSTTDRAAVEAATARVHAGKYEPGDGRLIFGAVRQTAVQCRYVLTFVGIDEVDDRQALVCRFLPGEAWDDMAQLDAEDVAMAAAEWRRQNPEGLAPRISEGHVPGQKTLPLEGNPEQGIPTLAENDGVDPLAPGKPLRYITAHESEYAESMLERAGIAGRDRENLLFEAFGRTILGTLTLAQYQRLIWDILPPIINKLERGPGPADDESGDVEPLSAVGA